MLVRRWWYLTVLAAAVVVAVSFLLGSASASAHKPAPPVQAPTKGKAPARVRGASTFACGMTVTGNFTLTSDESCPGSTAIFIEANGVTVNLNGHTLTGDQSPSNYGVEADFNNDVVTNGSILNFDYGVTMFGNGDKATSLQVYDDASGGIYADGAGAVVSSNYVLVNPLGVWLDGGANDQLTNNWVEGSTNNGIWVDNQTNMVISGNRALSTTGVGQGIVTENNTGQITGNVANGNASEGIYLDNLGTGVKPAVTFTGNRAAFNTDYGVQSVPGGAVDGGNNVVQDNGNAAQCLNIVCHEVDN